LLRDAVIRCGLPAIANRGGVADRAIGQAIPAAADGGAWGLRLTGSTEP